MTCFSGGLSVVAVAQRGYLSNRTAVERRIAKLIGKKAAGRYFRWELLPLTAAEQAALPQPARGQRRAKHRFVFHYDAAAADADAAHDGYAALVTTAAPTTSSHTSNNKAALFPARGI